MPHHPPHSSDPPQYGAAAMDPHLPPPPHKQNNTDREAARPALTKGHQKVKAEVILLHKHVRVQNLHIGT